MLNWIKSKFSSTADKSADKDLKLVAAEMHGKVPDTVAPGATGDEYFKNGNFVEAANSYQHALVIQPDDAELNNKLGDAYYEQRNCTQAEQYYRKALLIRPDFLDAAINLGLSLDELRRYDDAEQVYRQILHFHPDSHHVFFNLGVTLTSLGRLDEAMSWYRKALALRPKFSHAHFNLAILLQRQSLLDEAEYHYKQTIAADSGNFSAYCNLGMICKERGKFDEAEIYFHDALKINELHVETRNNLGLILQEKNKLEEAALCFQFILKIRPDFADAYGNLGDIYKKQSRLEDAEKCYKTAISLQPDVARYHCNLGIVYHETARYLEATASYQRSLSLDANSLNLFSNMGNTYSDRGMRVEAEQSYRKALEIKPDHAETYGNLLFLLNYDPDRSAEQIFAEYQAYDEKYARQHQDTWQVFSNDRNPQRRIKVAYVSPDFRRHSVQYFLEPLLAHHDRQAFELFAYAELKYEDEVSARYKSYIDHWIPTAGLSDTALTERIRADGIDILIDLAGHTGSNRLQVFARKPAPIQISWLGYGYTTGLKAIDYFLTDDTCAPSGAEAVFAEKLWRLETPSFAYRPADGMGEVSSLPALKNGYVTLGTLTRSVRLNHLTIRAWAAILKRIDGAKLLINSGNFKNADLRLDLEEKFAAFGIDKSRLEIGYDTPPWNTLRKIDIGLDCFPHNSGTTLFETLYMGIPYVTLAGRPSVGLLGSSILKGVNHPEWIAQTEEEYINKVVELASNIDALSQVRDNLREEMKQSKLMDEAGFAAKVDIALRTMWTKWCEETNLHRTGT
ncbi:tetratricopeptide repeat protein [Undibacterium sp. Ji83W]|uniref:tetratricopeptide repeat protein n=1 Tax=Undibacterium sp. Ji83W TaxID=3413043 RepID=UPI003BF15AF2